MFDISLRHTSCCSSILNMLKNNTLNAQNHLCREYLCMNWFVQHAMKSYMNMNGGCMCSKPWRKSSTEPWSSQQISQALSIIPSGSKHIPCSTQSNFGYFCAFRILNWDPVGSGWTLPSHWCEMKMQNMPTRCSRNFPKAFLKLASWRALQLR